MGAFLAGNISEFFIPSHKTVGVVVGGGVFLFTRSAFFSVVFCAVASQSVSQVWSVAAARSHFSAAAAAAAAVLTLQNANTAGKMKAVLAIVKNYN